MNERKRPEAPRGEKVLPGVWRLRLALPWPGVPHGNLWAVAAPDGGIVLFDTGIGGKGMTTGPALARESIDAISM